MLTGGIGSLPRRAALLAGIAALFACATAASANAAPLVLVGNWDGGTVSVIDSQTDQVVGESITVGSHPSSIAITPDGRFAYVASSGTNNVSVIEIGTRKVVGEPIEVADAETIAISPDGKRAYVVGDGSHVLTVIDTATNLVVAEVTLGSEPYGVAVSPDGAYVYTASPSTDTVEVVDAQTDEVVGEPIEVGANPNMIAFAPDGKTAYVVDYSGEELSAIDTATRQVTSIPAGPEPWGIAVSADGSRAFVADYSGDDVDVVNLTTKQVIKEIPVGEEPYEIALTPDGKTAYVADYESEDVRAINTTTYAEVGTPIKMPGLGPRQLAITPDQSPLAAFTAPSAYAASSTAFSGAASTDSDGTISAFEWSFGDGGTATGVSPDHTFAAAGTYQTKLSVVDDEGCGEAEVFTGRTAYCSGGASSLTRAVTVYPARNNFHFGRLIHNRKNGTVRLKVKLPGAGLVQLRGGQVHLVRRKIGAEGSMWLVIHPRIEVGKRLKKKHHLWVTVRVKFSPTGGTSKTKTRSLQLLRAPRKKHR
ncbi:MAG: PKD domain-containing protein [Solirubrobacterales bacterium]